MLTCLNSRGISITAEALTVQPRLREAGLGAGTAACHADLLVLAIEPDSNLLDTIFRIDVNFAECCDLFSHMTYIDR